MMEQESGQVLVDKSVRLAFFEFLDVLSRPGIDLHVLLETPAFLALCRILSWIIRASLSSLLKFDVDGSAKCIPGWSCANTAGDSQMRYVLKSQDALRALMFYSFHHPRLIESLDMAWGDKDLFRFAWMKSQTPFHMIQKPPGSAGVKHITYNLFCGHTMVQHDPAGRIVFFHRNTYELTGRADASQD
ncbi:hypothetical protein AC1031_012267, partial [Aphanomyces cochlioides]